MTDKIIGENARYLTDTEIEVILDRVFNAQKRLKVRTELKKMVITTDNPSSSVQAGCTTSIDIETLEDLAELRKRREIELMKEVEDKLKDDEDVKKGKKGK